MNPPQPNEAASLQLSAQARIDAVCDRFEADLKQGLRPVLDDRLKEVPESERPILMRELVFIEFQHALQHRDRERLQVYRQRFPQLDAEWIRAALQDDEA